MAKQTEQEKRAEMKQQATYLIENRPSVFRTGSIIVFLRYASSILSIVAYVYGILMLTKGKGHVFYVEVNDEEWLHMNTVALGILIIATGLMLNAIAWLCRLVKRRNWYILESFELIEYVENIK